MGKPTYEAFGDVRRGCGHRHRSISTALACADKDHDACRRLGGGSYSDRGVRRAHGESLTSEEYAELELLVDEQAAQ
jgi:hypothetical protein